MNPVKVPLKKPAKDRKRKAKNLSSQLQIQMLKVRH